jgi:transcriptional regulator with XRE-family HTH domain
MANSASKPQAQGLGQAITVRRAHLGLKRKELAEKAKLSYPYLSELENGGKEPSAKALRQIADALAMSVSELIAFGETYRPSDEPSEERWSTRSSGIRTSLLQERPDPADIVQTTRAPAFTSAVESPAPANEELRAFVRSVVREELQRLVADEVSVTVARELRRVLADTPGTG